MKKLLAMTVIAAALSQNAHATIVLDFEGAGSGAQLLNFYNGGTDSAGNSGTNYGIGFGSNALAAIDSDDGGSGNFANEPSSKTTMFFLSGSAVLNYAAGFDTGFSFFYSSSTAASVKVYDGIDATGTLLADIPLTAQFNQGCTGDPTGGFCNWTAVGASFAGIAKSIDFGGTVNQVGYDNITFGSSTPGKVPEPASLALVGAGIAAILRTRRRSAR
ncbi:hypothetical protein GCM10007933_00150 [Zoogloea oryzae]|uniref:Ice-binding protein C-terminal domain-containing protein n=1 Tax=Zoogloea oryzae TaxID=310767 RepID=A0ABQ6F5M8_9RHOO|nr:PEP-CTERM sorting domain-containing protein [Zoogloea oryzae]GLT20564.1 hypothetical protein GCM10007933_00150 [Zoogloea oryzae]